MNTDCAFYIGTTHDICQDYALSGNNIISITDGCSGSILSDIGSRILGVTAMNKISLLKSLNNLDEKEIVLLARPSIKILNIPSESLDSTLLCAVKTENLVEVVCYGDGAIGIIMKNKDIFIVEIEYTDNYPFYINYLYDSNGRYENWKQDHNKRKVKISLIKTDGTIEIIDSNCNTSSNLGIGNIKVNDYKIFVEILSTEVDSVVIMSDGVQSFYKSITSGTSKHNEKIESHTVIKELLDFKNYTGKFVQRRMNKFIKTCSINGWNHADDMSIASIHLGE